MGKKGSAKKGLNAASSFRFHTSMTLREESIGKKQTNINVKSKLKLEHLENLALWASGEASIPSLGAFFGHHLATCTEALGASPSSSLFPCLRCETILQPGYNCTIRVEKNKAKVRHRHKNAKISTKNHVVYTCHFCLHRNLKRGTPRGHVKEMCLSKIRPPSKPKPAVSAVQEPASSEYSKVSQVEVAKTNEIVSAEVSRDNPVINTPTTPSTRLTLLESKKRKRNKPGSKKAAESENQSGATETEKAVSTARKRKRKSWTSLREIAESSKHDNRRNLNNLTIPFFL